MTTYIKYIKALNLFGRFDISQEFQSGVNILHGRNGAGKTTLLHIIANVLNGDYERFAYLAFSEIEIGLRDSNSGSSSTVLLKSEYIDDDIIINVAINDRMVMEPISAKQVKSADEEESAQTRKREMARHIRGTSPIVQTAYFPAFRTMIEAWASPRDRPSYMYGPDGSIVNFREPSRHDVSATIFARDLFGNFVPILNYPSPLEIEQRIRAEARQVMLQIGHMDSELLTRFFLEVFSALSQQGQKIEQSSEKIISDIEKYSNELAEHPLQSSRDTDNDVYGELRRLLQTLEVSETAKDTVALRVLDIYRNSFVERVNVQNSAYQQIEQYLQSVNTFLETKKMILTSDKDMRSDLGVRLQFEDGTKTRMRVLSSGERQVVTLIYAASRMNKQQEIVLIDEPEISLHIDWQRDLLKNMEKQLGNRQIIACTHSPTIGADYEDRMFELHLAPTQSLNSHEIQSNIEAESESDFE